MTPEMTSEFFTDAYRKGLHLTTRLLLSKGLSVEEAEEFAQSAWARGWEARHQLREPDRIMTWVNTIAMHKMYSAKRGGHRQEELQDKHVYGPPPVAAKIDAEKLLQRCSPLDKSLIFHHYTAGFNMEEIGRMHGMSGAGIRVRIHRARTALRRYAVETPAKRAA
jgi:DNA-directed RNA polymerase specialized sigma24 family protein